MPTTTTVPLKPTPTKPMPKQMPKVWWCGCHTIATMPLKQMPTYQPTTLLTEPPWPLPPCHTTTTLLTTLQTTTLMPEPTRWCPPPTRRCRPPKCQSRRWPTYPTYPTDGSADVDATNTPKVPTGTPLWKQCFSKVIAMPTDRHHHRPPKCQHTDADRARLTTGSLLMPTTLLMMPTVSLIMSLRPLPDSWWGCRPRCHKHAKNGHSH